jgi:hypothetical protein
MVVYFDTGVPEQALRSLQEIVLFLRCETPPDEGVDGEFEHPSIAALYRNNAFVLQTSKTTLLFSRAHVSVGL